MRTAAVAAAAGALVGAVAALRALEWAVEVYVQHCARPRDDARMMP